MALQYSSLDEWENFIDIPEAFVYLVYGVTKLVLVMTILSNVILYNTCYKSCKKVSSDINNCHVCTCCSDCCWLAAYNIWKYFMFSMAEIVETVFGKSIGVVKRLDNEYIERKKNRHDIQTLYFHKKPISYTDISILAMVSLTLALALFTTFWDRFWLKEITECTLDPTIYCYPLAVPPESNAKLNISTENKILNCSKWEDLNSQRKITFCCFQVVYDLSEALGTTGGIVTIFGVSTKLGTKVLLHLTKCLLNENCEHCKFTWCQIVKYCCYCHCRKQCHRKNQLWIFRVIVATFLSLTELSVSFFIVAVYIGDLYEVDVLHKVFHSHRDVAANIFKNANKFVLPLGILSTTLFIPFENYATVRFTVDLTKDIDNDVENTPEIEAKEKCIYVHQSIPMTYTRHGAIGFTPTSALKGEQDITWCTTVS